MSICNNSETKIVLAEFNAKTGEGRQEFLEGSHGLDDRNERGDMLIEWCEEKELVIAKAWLKRHKLRLFTWKSPGKHTRNQID